MLVCGLVVVGFNFVVRGLPLRITICSVLYYVDLGLFVLVWVVLLCFGYYAGRYFAGFGCGVCCDF